MFKNPCKIKNPKSPPQKKNQEAWKLKLRLKTKKPGGPKKFLKKIRKPQNGFSYSTGEKKNRQIGKPNESKIYPLQNNRKCRGYETPTMMIIISNVSGKWYDGKITLRHALCNLLCSSYFRFIYPGLCLYDNLLHTKRVFVARQLLLTSC